MDKAKKPAPFAVPLIERGPGGPALVCGSAEGLLDDVARALRIFPGAALIGCNASIGKVRVTELVSLHPDKFPAWLELGARKWGGFRPRTHGLCKPEKLARAQRTKPYVDHWWHGVSAKGTSGWAARKVAAHLGYAPVVLCGIPIDVANYEGGGVAKIFRSEEAVEHYRAMITGDTSWHFGAYSMSGWTRELLGEPKVI